jgi:hypothetical protein
MDMMTGFPRSPDTSTGSVACCHGKLKRIAKQIPALE